MRHKFDVDTRLVCNIFVIVAQYNILLNFIDLWINKSPTYLFMFSLPHKVTNLSRDVTLGHFVAFFL
jgi:hypothetical protein